MPPSIASVLDKVRSEQIFDELSPADKRRARYHTDPEFRQRTIEGVKNWKAENPDKAKAHIKKYNALHGAENARRHRQRKKEAKNANGG